MSTIIGQSFYEHTVDNGLVTEDVHYSVPVKLESDQPGQFRFRAVVSEAGFVNRNGRRYPSDVLQRAFDEIANDLAGHPGAIDHPAPPYRLGVTDQGILWERFWAEGNLWYGEGIVIPTAKGKDLMALIEAGVSIGFSTRGYGKTVDDVTTDGKPVRTFIEYSFGTDGSVDAVIGPSVGHARIQSFSKEEEDKLEDKLQEAQAAQTAAEAALAEALLQVKALETENSHLKERVTALEAAEVERAKDAQKTALEAKLLTLTGEHRFGATIRTEVGKLIATGVATAENVDTLVENFRNLVEAAASAPREEAVVKGSLATEEDKPVAEGEVRIKVGSSERTLTPEEANELREMRLL